MKITERDMFNESERMQLALREIETISKRWGVSLKARSDRKEENGVLTIYNPKLQLEIVKDWQPDEEAREIFNRIKNQISNDKDVSQPE